jgi:ABC-2 type transport system ATP-binding protein
VALERTSTLLQRFAGTQLYLRFSEGALPTELRSLEVDISNLPNSNGNQHLLRLTSYDEVERILGLCRANGCKLEEMEVRKADLEDVFVQVMNGPEVIEGLA